MSVGVNTIVLLGNVVREVEVRYTDEGMALGNLSLAVNRTWKDKQGQKKQDCTFFRCVLMGQQAEFAAQYASKGRQVYVEGRVQFRKYTAKDGMEREVCEVVAKTMQLLGGRPDGAKPLPEQYGGKQQARTQPEAVREAYTGAHHYSEDECPF